MLRRLCQQRLVFILMVALPFVAAMPGCKRGPAMANVRGKVFYKDGSVPRAGVCVILFQPAPDSTAEIRKGASSAIESDGSFDMLTRIPGDGVYYGDYIVTFTIMKGPMDPTPLILPKYSSMTGSPYKITVDGNKSDLVYEVEPLPGVKGAAPTAAAGSTKTPSSG